MKGKERYTFKALPGKRKIWKPIGQKTLGKEKVSPFWAKPLTLLKGNSQREPLNIWKLRRIG